jgi:Family of unknown function (DUF5829)
MRTTAAPDSARMPDVGVCLRLPATVGCDPQEVDQRLGSSSHPSPQAAERRTFITAHLANNATCPDGGRSERAERVAKCLLRLAFVHRQTTGGQPLLDHVYAVVDAATADAIEHSEFLPRIAQFDVQVVRSGDRSWRGCYLRGRRTYVEIFGPDDVAGAPDHASGLGLATRRRGDLDVLAGRMGEAAERAHRGTTTRELRGEVGPWFDYLEVADETAILSTWIMEYLRNPTDDARRVALFDEWARRLPARSSVT